ncbi:uncharacterized protein SPSK_03807 [Sporothrix schenckii 1099-18]|uniref:Uncharacterized protein n=1 Tax=Sporothrix schenckii 1099-18 TaxID=1397361 RepID=A0A0F2LXQ2_SPOSC|nr:uncharacterized protein SPSK_03807 [Sporothrix schenckii 1099-18]KJR82238.1 hypothetical protein SPSK_03807 [Sporothrix schenckii 1099-18]
MVQAMQETRQNSTKYLVPSKLNGPATPETKRPNDIQRAKPVTGVAPVNKLAITRLPLHRRHPQGAQQLWDTPRHGELKEG